VTDAAGSVPIGSLPVGPLESALRAVRDAGRKSFVPYITGGYPDVWQMSINAACANGADALEIGLPFSDPVMDGPTIQEASELALRSGATPLSILDEVRDIDSRTPMAAMTYYNIAFRMGHQRFAESLAKAGVMAAILPDLPLEEVGAWTEVADEVGIETILLAAPTAPDARLPAICERSRGFVYGVGLLGITGEREELAASAIEMARRLKDVTDKPVLVGVGVSTPAQAVEACSVADGVIVGSAVVRQMMEHGPEAVGTLCAEFRSALDAAYS